LWWRWRFAPPKQGEIGCGGSACVAVVDPVVKVVVVVDVAVVVVVIAVSVIIVDIIAAVVVVFVVFGAEKEPCRRRCKAPQTTDDVATITAVAVCIDTFTATIAVTAAAATTTAATAAAAVVDVKSVFHVSLESASAAQ
jgi:hypothetical protein